MYKRGDEVEILPEYQDEGDDQFHWVCVNDEEKGRVDIMILELSNWQIPPIHTVQVHQIRLRTRAST